MKKNQDMGYGLGVGSPSNLSRQGNPRDQEKQTLEESQFLFFRLSKGLCPGWYMSPQCSFLGTERRNRESFREDISGLGGKGTESQGNSKSKDTERESTKTKEISNNVNVARILREQRL